MRNTQKILGAYAMMFAMASMGNMGYSGKTEYRELTDEQKEKLKTIAEKKRKIKTIYMSSKTIFLK